MTKYGYSTLGVVALLVFILFVIAILVNNSYLKYTLFGLGILLLGFSLNFFRDPDRITPLKDNLIISPADGKVLLIKKIIPNEFIKEESIQLSIFMSPLNVHVNRIPISGKVSFLKYIKGEYLVAYHDKADSRNERSMIGVTGKYGKVLFTQVAGAVARRIITDLKEGQDVKAGERFGMIKFGSRVDVIVPVKCKLNVKVGDNVFAGETILFEFIK